MKFADDRKLGGIMNTEEDPNIIQEDLYVNTVIEFHPMFITPKCAKHLKSYSKNFCYKLETHHLEMTEEERDLGCVG